MVMLMNDLKINIIAAVDSRNGGIGRQGELLVQDNSEDMRYFLKQTIGDTVIMGRKTADSLRGPLYGRQNIVLTRKKTLAPQLEALGFSVARSWTQAFEMTKHETVWVIGGGDIYRQALQYADKLFITLVKGENKPDTFFPPLFCKK